MQSFLGEYPGSRSNADIKFIRAVQSFLDQINKNSELIIASDGCMITHDLYYKLYKDEPRIKYIYVDKDTLKMYELIDNQKYYRGLPREVGRVIANGDIITYMDSDDLLTPQHTLALEIVWSKSKDKDWVINQAWYDNEYRQQNPIAGEEAVYEDSKLEPLISINNLDSLWYAVKGKPDSLPMQPWQLSHKKECITKWEDTIGKSEDVDFNQRLRAEYTNGVLYSYATYTRCHYSNMWDY